MKETPTPTSSLRTLAGAHNMHIGAAVALGPLQCESLYAETLAREFSMLTPENVMKFGPLHPEQERYDFAAADAIVAFARSHDMQVRGHTLVWHNQLPSWLTKRDWTREALIEILREHITTVVGRYRGRVGAWDVVNEAVADDGSLRDTIWLQGIGPEYLDMAFRWAHEADPEARLFYNDYNGEGQGCKADAIYKWVRDFVRRGVPIRGVGLQMHVALDRFPEPQAVAANVERLAGLGLEVHITEMDVRIEEPATAEDLHRQASVYGDMLRVCLTADNCSAFVLWGFTDRWSWIPHFFEGCGRALILDEDYRPKPAYHALREALSAH